MDFEPGTTVFPVVITGIVVLPNGQVTVVTPNGTFLADTTIVPRPVLKPTVLEDKNGNQFIVHPDGTVTNLGQAGFIPKPMTTEEKLDKIRRGLYLEALKDYKTQIETYYTSKNEPIPTRGPRNHNKNIIIDLPECIGTEANEIKDNFLAIKDNVNKKELREKSLKRILGTSKKTTLDALAQTALTNLSARVKITESEFRQFLSILQFKTEKDSICGEWKAIPIISLESGNHYFDYNGNFLFAEFGTDNGIRVVLPSNLSNSIIPVFYVYPPISFSYELYWEKVTGFMYDIQATEDIKISFYPNTSIRAITLKSEALSKIATFYNKNVGNSNKIFVGPGMSVAHTNTIDNNVYISIDFRKGIDNSLENYYSMIGTIVHENYHKNNHQGKGSLELPYQEAILHLQAYEAEIKHTSFKKVPIKYQARVISNVGQYLSTINPNKDTTGEWYNKAQERKLYFENLLGITFETLIGKNAVVKWKIKNTTQILSLQYYENR